MDNFNKNLMLKQLDRKIKQLSVLEGIQTPQGGWIKTIRTALNMTLVQLAKKLNKSSPTVKELEDREANKTITLKKLMELGEALNLKFVYGFIPYEGSLEKMIEKRALILAESIIRKTSHNMALEDQQNTEERLKEAIKERAAKLKEEKPKYLWD
ncbi:MAG: mobile mystery protein A [Chlorobi bacterium]|nr:mobile mystery protein A [Chlorobiota bacterium]